MILGEVLGLKIQDRLDAERSTLPTATIELSQTPSERESFRMRGLYGEIPGSSCDPIHVECWSARD
jgi:hypothetical protein